MAKVDLHIHSTASDGRYSPAEIVHKAAAAKLTVIALADHDTVDGIIPALKAAESLPQLTVIPCVELSTDVPDGEVHVLGYFIDYTAPELQVALMKMRNSRRERAQKMVVKLRDLGMPLEWDRVREIAGASAYGRPHIAQALLEKGYISSIKEAFTKYIGRGGPAYVEREKMTPVDAVELILRYNGLPVLAHPFTAPDPESMVIELKGAGLAGLEAYYSNYTPDEINRLVRLANRYGLITTGGSDYHGLDDTAEPMMGSVSVPLDSVERLLELAEQRTAKPAGQ